MSGSRLRCALVALLVVATLWPALHHGLARRFELDPWELFGWAMYSVPHPRVQVIVEVRVDDQLRALQPRGSLLDRVRAHARRRTTLGRWVSDEAFARELLLDHPDWDAVELTTRRWHLDRESARFSTRDETVVVER